MRVAALLLLVACSSRPALPERIVDAGNECDECWDECGQAQSFKVALFCSQQCTEICHAEEH